MSGLNPENKCMDIKPESIEQLPENDSLKRIFKEQEKLQDKLGRMELYKKSILYDKCEFIKDSIVCMNIELGEMMERLPFKHWKKYPVEAMVDWVDDGQRTETLFEYVDALHFLVNVALILGFSAEEIFNYYMAKNKENVGRQDKGY